MYKKGWILTGNEENWRVAISDKIWGVREGRLQKLWAKLEKGDLLLFYAKSPIKGIVGLGTVETKFRQDKPLWPDEIESGEVIYPYRFDFNIIYYLSDLRGGKSINIADLTASYAAGLNPVNREDVIGEILKRAKDKWNVDLPLLSYEVKAQQFQKSPNLHHQIRDKLYTIGQLENFKKDMGSGMNL